MYEISDIPAQEVQKEKIQMLLSKSLQIGETWFIVSAKWMSSFKQFIGVEKFGSTRVLHPGPVDNGTILDENNELRRALVDKMDYEVVPSECWNLLMKWYGLRSDQKPIPRKVIRIPTTNYLNIEVYPVELKCFKNIKSKMPVKLIVSKSDPITKVNNELRKIYNINQNIATRLTAIIGDGIPFMVKQDSTVAEEGLSSGNTLIIEEGSGDDNTPPLSRTSKHINKTAPSSSSYLVGTSSRSSAYSNYNRQPGVCGLNNLGNTCFMNSVLQCMSNCPPITDYFLSDKHMSELNETNPLGMKGEIARIYGELIQTIWSGNFLTANPLSFKVQVGKFNPSFSGFQQHDSQELLTFLLDGLHEDLNRIKKKPYVEIKNPIGKSDSELAKEAWVNYRKRNDSIIVDTFHGLLKSRVVCPECELVSVTFDPFCCLSLPLPIKKDRLITVRFIPFEGNRRENKFRVSVPRKGIIRDLCQELAERISCKPNQLLVAEIVHCHFHKFYYNEDCLDNIDEKDVIFVYQLPSIPSSSSSSSTNNEDEDDDDDIIVPVCFWERGKLNERFSQNHLFGIPIFIALPRKSLTISEVHSILREKMRRHFIFQNNIDTSASDGKYFPLFAMDTTRLTLNPQPLEFINNVLNLRDIIKENYGNKYFGRILLIVQLSSEERRKYYREKPAQYGPDLIISQSSYREKNSPIDILDCISLFTTCEKLSADDAWYCPTCKKHQRATKKFDLSKLPRILIIQLKRFYYSRFRRDKIDSLIMFPINNLTLTNYVINREGPDMTYDLISVCNHYGTMAGGHYTAYCKNKLTNKWYCFDDSSVTQIQSEDTIMSSSAYVLFYMAKDKTVADQKMDVN